MKILARPTLFAAALAMALAGCSDDEGTTGTTKPDTTPPAVTLVTAVDAFHIDVTFNEKVQRSSAERHDNYVILEATTARPGTMAIGEAASPGDTLHVGHASLSTDQLTVSISTTEPMSSVNYDISVTGVKDASGNAITTPATSSFAGSTAADVTPPEIVYRNPASNATGVLVGQPVVFTFSEAVDFLSVESGVSWTRTSGGTPVAHEIDYDGTSFALTPYNPLSPGTQYTVSLSGVQDFNANTMPASSWSFTTTSAVDNTPPTVVASTPADKATNVNVNTNLSLTFSEAVNQVTLQVQLIPDPGDGTDVWSNGGKTVTFDPDVSLASNQQYLLSILPGGVEDLSGNKFAGIKNIVFSTGSSLEAGRFRGMIAGDPQSSAASDPTGALVAAPNTSPFENGDDFIIYGSAVVASNDTYEIQYLPDGVYYPISVMNTNGDDEIDPSTGDAIGAYGIDFNNPSSMLDSVVISGGNLVTDVDFQLFDMSAIVGQIFYDGFYAGDSYALYIGVFDVVGFDPTAPPDYGTTAEWPSNTFFRFNALDDGLMDGTYYVAAFLDVDFNGMYDPAMDPAGLYGGTTPTAINIQNGSDAIGLTILLQDPVPGARPSAGVVWPEPANRAPWLKRLSEAIREQGLQSAARTR